MCTDLNDQRWLRIGHAPICERRGDERDHRALEASDIAISLGKTDETVAFSSLGGVKFVSANELGECSPRELGVCRYEGFDSCNAASLYCTLRFWF